MCPSESASLTPEPIEHRDGRSRPAQPLGPSQRFDDQPHAILPKPFRVHPHASAALLTPPRLSAEEVTFSTARGVAA